MNTKQLNLLNIGLMIISAIVAFIIPFELFLFVYAVLGPLHYLTEISWLHKRNYFVKGKYDYLWLIMIGLFGTLAYFGVPEFKKWGNIAPYIALMSALVFFVVKDWYLKLVGIMLVFITAAMFNENTFYFLFFLIFLPTIIHVFVFTGSFMLHGAIKSKSVTGFISVLIFVLCAVSFFIFSPEFTNYVVGDYVLKAYKDFSLLNRELINLFGMDDLKSFDQRTVQTIFSSETGLKVMRFIAFAYTYHYLNWFSKTSIIKWHQVEKKYLIATLSLWIISVAVYLKDYQSGLKLLFFLSFLHVVLEFPLNWKTFIDLGQEAKNIRLTKAKA